MQVSYHTKSAQIFLRAEYNLPEEHVNYQAFSKKKKIPGHEEFGSRIEL